MLGLARRRSCVGFFGNGGGFALMGFQDLRAPLSECIVSAELGYRLVCLLALLFAVLEELPSDLRSKRFGPIDGGILEFFVNTGRAECGVPVGIDIGGGDVELIS